MRNYMSQGTFLAFIVLGLWLLSSCSSLPLPDSPEQSLLIVPYEFRSTRMRDDRRATGATVRVRNLDTGEDHSVRLRTSQTWAAIALEPGTYRMEQIRTGFTQEDNSWHDTKRVFTPVVVPEQSVVVSPSRFLFRVTNDLWNYSWTVMRNRSTTRHAQVATEEIQNDRLWPAWQGYDPINFYEEP